MRACEILLLLLQLKSIMRYPVEHIHALKMTLRRLQATQFHVVYLEWVIPKDKLKEVWTIPRAICNNK